MYCNASPIALWLKDNSGNVPSVNRSAIDIKKINPDLGLKTPLKRDRIFLKQWLYSFYVELVSNARNHL